MSRVDAGLLRQIFDEAGLQYGQTAKSFVFNCPRCSGKKKLYISKSGGRFVCWKCKETANYQGRPEYAIADLLGQSVRAVASRLYGGTYVPVEVYLEPRLIDFFGDDDIDEELIDEEIKEIAWPLDYYPITDSTSSKGLEYLKGRGIPVWMAAQYGLQYNPLKKRVAFPVQSNGVLYGYQERLIVPNQWIDSRGVLRERPKVLSSINIPRDRTLMFTDRLTDVEHAVLTEGPIDALKAHFCGGNVCAMGKAVAPRQFQLLVNAGIKRVYLALDADAAGEIQRLARDYYDDVELYEMIAPQQGGQKNDLGAMSFASVYDLFLSARKITVGRLFVYLRPVL